MKNIFSSIIFCILLLSLGSGCKKDDNTLNTNVTAVSTFFSPLDSAFYDLEKSSSVLFEWEPAQAADGNLVQYVIAFDKPGGDFSAPVYETASDGNGLYNRATLTKDILNRICRLAGVESAQAGELKWTVYSTKGVNKVAAAVSRLIKLQRPFGLDNPPSNVYITGTATEGGSDLAKAIKMKQTGDGLYEIYTSLKPGAFYFTDANSGSQVNQYYLSSGTIREGEDSSAVTSSKIYRIQLNFSVLTATVTEVKEVGLWFAAENKILFNLDYDHNGIWKAENKLITFFQESWGRDERYKFRFTVNDGKTDSYEFYGSSNSDNNRPTAATNPSFWYLLPVNNSQYDYCYKFVSEADNARCTINVYMSPDKANYTHEVIVL